MKELILFLGLLFSMFHVFGKETDPSKKPPHILFIYTDDHALWGVSAYGNRDAHTANIDRLATEGAKFENAFVTI